MSVEIKGVDVAALMAEVNRRIEAKRETLVSDAEVREIAERPLEAAVDGNEFRSGLLAELQHGAARWGYTFDAETIYRSSRGGALETVRRFLRPVQKLFWNPNPMIAALSRQSSINQYQAHLLHNLVEELTRLRLEVQELKNRSLHMQARIEFLARREKAFEELSLGKPKA
jgi:hypothetical protein